MKPRGRVRRAAQALAAVVLAGGTISAPLGTGVARADGRAFIGIAEASGVSARYGIPGFLAVQNYIDGGGPVAQAVLGSDGSAEGFASLPYPGSTAISYPGLVATFTGSAPPGYPLYASALHPTQPEQSVSDPSGTYVLEAQANAERAAGDARVAPSGEPTAIRAHSEVVPGQDSVAATAFSVVEGFTVGPLSVGLVRSQSVATYRRGDEKAATQTELVVEAGRAGDLAFTYGPEGLKVAQQGIPVPAGEGLAFLNQALAPAGLSMEFQKMTPLEGGARAAAFEIVSVADVPGAGQGTFRMRLGGATAAISLGDPAAPEPIPEGLDPGATPEVPAAVDEPPAPTGSTGGPGELSPADGISTPAIAAPFDENAAGEALNDVSAPAAAEAPVPLAAPASALETSLEEFRATSALAGVLAGGGALGLGVLALWGWARSRRSWTV